MFSTISNGLCKTYSFISDSLQTNLTHCKQISKTEFGRDFCSYVIKASSSQNFRPNPQSSMELYHCYEWHTDYKWNENSGSYLRNAGGLSRCDYWKSENLIENTFKDFVSKELDYKNQQDIQNVALTIFVLGSLLLLGHIVYKKYKTPKLINNTNKSE